MCFFFFILCKWTLLIETFFPSHACCCFYVMKLRKQKNIFCTNEASLCFTQKNNFCIMNKIIFLSKNVILLYISKIFFYHVTLENIFRILNNSAYFQNIVVCKEPFQFCFLYYGSFPYCHHYIEHSQDFLVCF